MLKPLMLLLFALLGTSPPGGSFLPLTAAGAAANAVRPGALMVTLLTPRQLTATSVGILGLLAGPDQPLKLGRTGILRAPSLPVQGVPLTSSDSAREGGSKISGPPRPHTLDDLLLLLLSLAPPQEASSVLAARLGLLSKRSAAMTCHMMACLAWVWVGLPLRQTACSLTGSWRRCLVSCLSSACRWVLSLR